MRCVSSDKIHFVYAIRALKLCLAPLQACATLERAFCRFTVLLSVFRVFAACSFQGETGTRHAIGSGIARLILSERPFIYSRLEKRSLPAAKDRPRILSFSAIFLPRRSLRS